MDLAGGTKLVAGSLKNVQAAAKELGSVVSAQQTDMELSVQQQHRARLTAKAQEQRRAGMLDWQALKQFEIEKAHQQEIAKCKQETQRRYGKTAWEEVQAVKVRMQREREDELKHMDKDRQLQNQVFWWCATASAVLTYFFQLYK